MCKPKFRGILIQIAFFSNGQTNICYVYRVALGELKPDIVLLYISSPKVEIEVMKDLDTCDRINEKVRIFQSFGNGQTFLYAELQLTKYGKSSIVSLWT